MIRLEAGLLHRDSLSHTAIQSCYLLAAFLYDSGDENVLGKEKRDCKGKFSGVMSRPPCLSGAIRPVPKKLMFTSKRVKK